MQRDAGRQSFLPLVSLPMPDGKTADFTVFEAPILGDPGSPIRSYTGRAVEDPTCLVRINVSPNGMYAIIHDGRAFTEIRKKSITSRDNDYTVAVLEENGIGQYMCEHQRMFRPESIDLRNSTQNILINSCFQAGAQLRTFRTAISVTYEFATENGFTLSLVNDAIANRLAAVNLVFERDAAVRMVLVANNDLLINDILSRANAASDPYTDPTNTVTSYNQGGVFITNTIGSANFDIGHSFHEEPSGFQGTIRGRAEIGSVCDDFNFSGTRKAWGYSTLINGSSNVILMVHEFGHQFSCRHTNYGCGTPDQCERYEPGQGSTIMSTGAGCSADTRNIFQSSRDEFFSVESLSQINDFLSTGIVIFDDTDNNGNPTCRDAQLLGNTCLANTSTGNSPPTANANPMGSTMIIPKGTPFTLTGLGTDPDPADVLTYSWEQIDQDLEGSAVPSAAANIPNAPLFRVRNPTTSSSRTFPAIENVLSGADPNTTGETLPGTARTMNFALLVRDNRPGGGGTACDQVAVQVTNDGPFVVNSQNAGGSFTGGQSITVTWDAAGTASAPISCSNVDILLSVDGGQTYPYVLMEATANDNSESVTLPDISSSTVRIKVACSDNIFFDVNNADITLTASNNCLAAENVLAPATDCQFNVGDAGLNLDLAHFFSNGQLSTAAISYNSSSPAISMARINNQSNECEIIKFTGTSIDIVRPHGFILFSVDQDGLYGLLHPGDKFRILSIFEENSFVASDPCASLKGTTGSGNTGTSSTSAGQLLAVDLKAGVIYRAATYNFDLSDSYDLQFLSAAGNIYQVVTGPGNEFAYTYVATDKNSEVVKGVSASADFQTLPEGEYCIYGVNYKASGATPPSIVNPANFVDRQLNDIINMDGCLRVSLTKKRISVNCTSPKRLDLKVFVQGGYDSGTGNLIANLRTLAEFPAAEPFTGLGHTVVQNPSGCIDPLVLKTVSPASDIIVDYVYVELRTGLGANTFLTSKVGLLKTDGTIVNLDGSPFSICAANGNYHVVVRHRNHLGVISRGTVSL